MSMLVGMAGCNLLEKTYSLDDADFVGEVWNCIEIPFTSDKEYENPLFDLKLDVVFSKGGEELTVPAFWDGGDSWKVRFAPTEKGLWKYETKCDDASNTGLNGVKGTVGVNKYSGDLEIYKRGFVRSEKDARYLVYDDGTPFFWLGDTHWGMPTENLEGVGEVPEEDASKVEGIDSHFKYIVDKRVEQGFTVYQSEPIGTKYNLKDGFSEDDLAGFQDLDERFAYIAQKGLVHANAQLMFTSDIIKGWNEKKNEWDIYTQEELSAYSRFWVARYGAYPVIWTTAQEVDNDFYYERRDQSAFTRETNPWVTVAQMVCDSDAYNHPLSAHTEIASTDTSDTAFGTNCATSAFKNVSGHNWWAVQWSPDYQNKEPFDVPRMYWEQGANKPVVNYEGSYDHLWTLEFGARAQGWISFLSGMYGYGYGCADIWLYNSTYDMDADTVRGNVTITVDDKKMKWYDSVNLPSATQVGYMKKYLEEKEWYNLVPRFYDTEWSQMAEDCFFTLASDEDKRFVVYIYNTTKSTGTLKQLNSKKDYVAEWLNPRTNERIGVDNVDVAGDGSWQIPEKPDEQDWVLCVEQK